MVNAVILQRLTVAPGSIAPACHRCGGREEINGG